MPHEYAIANPRFADSLAARGIDTPAAFLDLPGEVVSGHPDRHVLRVEIPGFSTAFYLKRQHVVSWRERLHNWRDGFGWMSRSEREANVLQQLGASGLPCPRWVAVGSDARGRAFLMVEEVADSTDLRSVLMDCNLSVHDRERLAERIGNLIGQLHASAFTTPDLTAKHLLVSRRTGAIVPIDWQRARRVGHISLNDRVRALATLHASVADELASPRERLRVLRSAMRAGGGPAERLSALARQIVREAQRYSKRRSIRDQRQASAGDQRLVWLAEEAVCAIPGVSATWPSPAIATPFYGCEPGRLSIQLPDGRKACLIRGRSFAPAGRLRAWIGGKSWRSPGVTFGRLLFHLERYGIPAPRLLAFGQRLTGPASAEWFALHIPPAPPLRELSFSSAEQLGNSLRQLHDAGCRLAANPLSAFGMNSTISIRDVTAVRLVKRLSQHQRRVDLRQLCDCLEPNLRPAIEAGYASLPGMRPTTPKRRHPMSLSR